MSKKKKKTERELVLYAETKCLGKEGAGAAGAAYAVCTSIYRTLFDELCYVIAAFGEDHPLSRALLKAQEEVAEAIDESREAIWLRLAHRRDENPQNIESRPDRTQDDG